MRRAQDAQPKPPGAAGRSGTGETVGKSLLYGPLEKVRHRLLYLADEFDLHSARRDELRFKLVQFLRPPFRCAPRAAQYPPHLLAVLLQDGLGLESDARGLRLSTPTT